MASGAVASIHQAQFKPLPKRQLDRLERQWRIAVRETIKRLPCPGAGADMLRLFDAAIDELNGGRQIVVATCELAKKKGLVL